METIAFTAVLERVQMFRVGVVLSLRNPLSLTAMASGPVLWVSGTLAGGTMVRDFGSTLMFLIVAVPAVAVLVASYAAYRPGAAELYVPVEWAFSSAGVRIRQNGKDAFAEWAEFAGWRRVADCYLLHTSKHRYVVLPAFGLAPAQRQALETLMSEHAGVIR